MLSRKVISRTLPQKLLHISPHGNAFRWERKSRTFWTGHIKSRWLAGNPPEAFHWGSFMLCYFCGIFPLGQSSHSLLNKYSRLVSKLLVISREMVNSFLLFPFDSAGKAQFQIACSYLTQLFSSPDHNLNLFPLWGICHLSTINDLHEEVYRSLSSGKAYKR